MRVVAWLLVLGLCTFVGMVAGIVVADALSDCRSLAGNAQHCLGPALLGLGLGTVGGFAVGSAAVIEWGRRSGRGGEAAQTIVFGVVLTIIVVLGWSVAG